MSEKSATQGLNLSPTVSRQVQNHYTFGPDSENTVGMLFGSVDEDGQGQVHYAPAFLPQIVRSLRQHDYAYGRYEASVEAAYHLCGWFNLGYWLAYQGTELGPEQALSRLNSSLGGAISLPEPVLFTVRLTLTGDRVYRAVTYTTVHQLTGWRELTLTYSYAPLIEMKDPTGAVSGELSTAVVGKVSGGLDAE